MIRKAKKSVRAALAIEKADPTAVAKAALEGERAELEALLEGTESDHWQVGFHYNTVVDGHMAEKAGYAHAKDFFSENFKETAQTTLSEYGAVAKTFEESDAQKYGASKLYLLITYENAVKASPASGDPGKTVIQVPSKAGATVSKAFADCTAKEIRAATTAAWAPTAPAIPAADAAIISSVGAALESTLGKGHGALKAHVHGHVTVISLENIPLPQLATLLDALKAAVAAPAPRLRARRKRRAA